MTNLDPTTIFVRNLSYGTTQENFAAAFQQFGEVKSARIILRRFRGEVKSRGIGFVEFNSEEAVRQAITKEGGIELDGRTLSILQARVRAERKRDTAFISGLKEGTTKEHILEAFKTWNPTDARIVKFDNDRYRGFGFVKFASTEERDQAVKAGRTIQIDGQESQVRYARLDFDAPPRPARRRFNTNNNSRRAPKNNSNANNNNNQQQQPNNQ